MNMANKLHNNHSGTRNLRERLSKLVREHSNISDNIERMLSSTALPMDQLLALADVVDNPNPLHTSAHQFERVASMGAKLQKNSTAMLNAASTEYTSGMALLNTLADTRLKLKTETKYQTLILQKYAPQGKAAVFAALVKAMKEGDWETFAALNNAPTSVTDLTSEERDRSRMEYIGIHAPDIAADFVTLKDAIEVIIAIDRPISASVHEVSEPRKLAEINKGVAAAEAAERSFDNPASQT